MSNTEPSDTTDAPTDDHQSVATNDPDATPDPDVDVEVVEFQRHRNGDETAVLLCGFGGGYQALALDIDAGGQVLEVEEIGDDPDHQTAEGMVSYWVQQHPDGVLGAVEEEDDSLLGGLFGGGDGA